MRDNGKKTLRYWLFYSFWVIVPVITIIISAALYGVGLIGIIGIPFMMMFIFGVLAQALRDFFWEEYERVYGEKR